MLRLSAALDFFKIMALMKDSLIESNHSNPGIFQLMSLRMRSVQHLTWTVTGLIRWQLLCGQVHFLYRLISLSVSCQLSNFIHLFSFITKNELTAELSVHILSSVYSYCIWAINISTRGQIKSTNQQLFCYLTSLQDLQIKHCDGLLQMLICVLADYKHKWLWFMITDSSLLQ